MRLFVAINPQPPAGAMRWWFLEIILTSATELTNERDALWFVFNSFTDRNVGFCVLCAGAWGLVSRIN